MTRSSWLSLSGNPRHAIVFTTLSHLPAWWQTVDGNPSWQSGVFFGLAGAYGIIGLVAVVQLIRIQLRVPEYGWTTQKMFHLLNFIVCVLRMSVFVLREPIASLKPVALQSVLLDLPGLLFTTTYTLLVLFWAEIYHQAKTLPTGNLRPTFIAFNLLVYAIQVGIWCFIAGSEKGSNLRIARSLSAGFMGLVALAAAGGFILYGGRLFLMLRGFPVDSRGRKKKIQEVPLAPIPPNSSVIPLPEVFLLLRASHSHGASPRPPLCCLQSLRSATCGSDSCGGVANERCLQRVFRRQIGT
mmetsp:Transcript_28192/g.66954  ORF Transcript_28192/g.66954 Transcript_28192/m.66954 type:complete len:298 (+) Transcript_28192:105-998(+)